MIWTALVGITLGIGRWLIPDGLDSQFGSPREAIAIFCVLTAFNVLLALPVVWGSFVNRWVPIRFGVAAVCCVGLTVVEISVFKAATGIGGADDEIFWLMNGIQFLGASVCLLLVRACGFRLVQTST